jgi:hypothetical protein
MNKKCAPPLSKKTLAAGPASPSSATKGTSASKEAPRDPFLGVLHGLRAQGVSEKELADGLVMKLLMRSDLLFGRIEEAFAGQPFLPEVAPNARASQHRFNAYVGNQAQAAKLLGFAVNLATISGNTAANPKDTGR